MALTDNENLNHDDIIDINLEGIKRKRFRINGDPNAIIELNLSDLGIMERLNVGLDKLATEMSNISNIPDDAEDETFQTKLKEADARMREYVDYIFDYPVSAVCAKYGTMYDPQDGQFKYEIIIDGLTKLYADNLNSEFKKIQTRIKKHTDKYTNASAISRKKKK